MIKISKKLSSLDYPISKRFSNKSFQDNILDRCS